MKYYAIAIIPLILAYPAYSIFYPSPSLEEIQNKLIQEQNELIEKTNNTKLERYKQELIECMQSASWEILKELSSCSNRPKPILQELVGTNAKATTGSVIPVPERQEVKSVSVGLDEYYFLEWLHEKVCKKQINSPLCKDRALFDRLYQITEERIPGKQFFPILLGMTNSESSLGLDMAKDKVGGFCYGRNNWWGAKYQILDNNTRVYKRELNWFSYKYPIDQFWCNLYPFESIEEYWTSKVNWIRFGYKGCIDSKTPIACISVHYVWSEKVVKPQWVRNASIFIE